MMVTINHSFKVDQLQLKHAKDANTLLHAIKQAQAAAFGKGLVEQLGGFVKNDEESWKGPLPEASLNRDHEFQDIYELKFRIIPETNWDAFEKELDWMENQHPELSPVINKIKRDLCKG